jgi:hypothetical protein
MQLSASLHELVEKELEFYYQTLALILGSTKQAQALRLLLTAEMEKMGRLVLLMKKYLLVLIMRHRLLYQMRLKQQLLLSRRMLVHVLQLMLEQRH